jgi:hypothetical protein
MANLAKKLFRGSASTGNTTLYTVPAGTTTVVTNILISNTTSTERTATLLLDGVEILKDTPISGTSAIVVDLKQTLEAADLIEGSASATTVRFHISGMEIS